MKYHLIGTTVPAVEVTLDRGESLFTQSGAMSWMTDGIEMQTNTHGGLLKGLGRMFAGESMFQSTFSSDRAGAMIAFSATAPGVIVPYDLTGKPDLICQKGAFLCAQPEVKLNVTLTKRFSGGLLGGEGFVLEKLSGEGLAFLEVDGDAKELTLAPGETLRVDTGNVVAFETTVAYQVETVKGAMNLFFGGEGLFLTRLTGPGKVILQTLSFNDFAGRVIAMIPPSSN
ncbi:MAG: TIGR00266 family protein [Clostridia bacterium]